MSGRQSGRQSSYKRSGIKEGMMYGNLKQGERAQDKSCGWWDGTCPLLLVLYQFQVVANQTKYMAAGGD